MVMLCRSCGAENRLDARFCSQCGVIQGSPAEERRVVSVVFADIVGFTAMSEGSDPETVKRLMDHCFSRLVRDIRSYGGVVDKIVGDAIVALFGAPTAHEDDAERAVRASLAMQQTLAAMFDSVDQIKMRIGVNTGEVLVGSMAAGGAYTAMGDVMNSASRLEQMAEPGQVLVGHLTKVATERAIRYERLGLLKTKGRDEPIEAWLAVEPLQPPGLSRHGLEVFVGREDELALLEAQGRMVLSRKRAQMTLISAAAGMGKNRLAQEAATKLAGSGVAVYEARCLPYGEANVWWPIAELLRQMFGLAQGLDWSEAEELVRSEIKQRWPKESSAEQERLLIVLLHTLGYDTPMRQADKTRNRKEVTEAVSQLFDYQTLSQGVVVVLSDVHWAAPPVRALLENLLNRLYSRGFFVMATARPVEEKGWEHNLMDSHHGMTVMRIGPLSSVESQAMLERLQPNLDAEMKEQLLARAGGNPFFLQELSCLVEGRLAEGSKDPLGGDGLVGLPETLRGLIAARLDALDSNERALIESAAMLGSSGELSSLFGLWAGQVEPLASQAKEELFRSVVQYLMTQDLISVDAVRFRLRSDLIREVAYGTLTKSERALRHFRIAEQLEKRPEGLRNSRVVVIAEHYRAAALLGAEVPNPDLDMTVLVAKAVKWLEQAGDRAMAAGEPVEGARWYSMGLDLVGDTDTALTFRLGRARARCEVHDLSGAHNDLNHLDRMFSLSPAHRAEALVIKGDVLRKSGDLDSAAMVLGKAIVELTDLNGDHQLALAWRLLGLTEMERLDDDAARFAFECSRAVAADGGDLLGEAWALQSMAWNAFVRGRILEAGDLVVQAVELFEFLDDSSGLAWAHGVQTWVLFHLGRWDESRDLIDRILPVLRRRGDPWAEAIMAVLAALLQLWSGQANSALELLDEAREHSRKADDAMLLTLARAIEGRALVSLGHVVQGGDRLLRAFDLAAASGELSAQNMAVVAICASAARLGEYGRVEKWALRYNADVALWQGDLTYAVGLSLLQQGRVDEVTDRLDSAKVVIPERRHGENIVLLRALLAVVKGEVGKAEQFVEQILAVPNAYLDRVMALLLRAVIAFRDGDSDGFEQSLQQARIVLATTDDCFTGWLLDLVAGLCGHGNLAAARQRLISAGLDPTGLENLWSRVAGLSSS